MRKIFFSIFLLVSSLSSLRADQSTDDYAAGAALFKQKLYQNSSLYLERAVKTNPNFWQAFQVLGYDYAGLGDYRRALPAIERSLALYPNNPGLSAYADKIRTLIAPIPAPDSLTLPVTTLGQETNLPAPVSNPAPATAPASVKNSYLKNFIYFSLGGGLPLSPENFTGSWTNGYSVGLGYGLQLSPQFSLLLDGSGSFFPVNKKKFPALFIAGGDVYDWTLLLSGKYNFAPVQEAFSPYVLLGGGLSVYQATDRTVTDFSSGQVDYVAAGDELGFGFRAGIGADIKLSNNNAFFAEADGVYTLGNNQLSYMVGRLGLKTGF